MSHSNSIDWKHVFAPKALFLTLLGVFFAVIAFNGFMIPAHFIDGGVNGLSIVLSHVFHINIAVPLIVLNLPFIYIGYKKIGKTFAVQTLIAIVLVAIGVQFIEVPTVTSDPVLIAGFGGIFIGLAIGFVIKGGGVIDGMEVVAVYTNSKSKFSTNEILLAITVIIFGLLALNFGLDNAMYSTITYFTAIKTSDYIVDGFEGYTSLTIVGKDQEAIKSLIVNDFGKAISVYKGERGYLPGSFDFKQDCDIIVTVVTRLEIFNIQQAIHKADPTAFIYVHSLKDVQGGVVKRLRSH